MKYLPAALLLISPLLFAGTIYKYTDENGNIAYSNTKPLNIESKPVTVQHTNELKTDNEAQQHLEQSYQKAVADNQRKKQARQENQKTRNDAHQALKNAQKALEDAKVIRQGDMHPVPAGGVRYTDQYRSRIESAENAVSEAQKAYNKAR